MANKFFITMIGPEQRVLGCFQQQHTLESDKFVMFVNKEFQVDPRVIEYKAGILDILRDKADRIDILITSYFSSLELVKQFNQYVSEHQINLELADIHIDISTFNRQNLLTILYLLRKKFNVNKITCYYTIPNETNKDISKFACNSTTIPLFGGKQSIDKNKLLVLLVGFEFDRALYLWEKVEPSKTIMATGDKPTDEKFLKVNREVVLELKKRIDCEDASVSAKDPFRAQEDIENIIKKYRGSYNIIVAPMNTKLQTVGLYLAWENYPEIQIVYSCPESFGSWLSKGIKRTDSFVLVKN